MTLLDHQHARVRVIGHPGTDERVRRDPLGSVCGGCTLAASGLLRCSYPCQCAGRPTDPSTWLAKAGARSSIQRGNAVIRPGRRLPRRIGDNFLYVFKGARSAPRAWRRVTAYAARRESGAPAEGGREAPAGNSPHQLRPLALVR